VSSISGERQDRLVTFWRRVTNAFDYTDREATPSLHSGPLFVLHLDLDPNTEGATFGAPHLGGKNAMPKNLPSIVV
jgi:hypothetical protein